MYSVNQAAPSGFGFQDNGRGADKSREMLQQRLTEALQKIKSFSFIQLCLALALTVCGIATLVVAADNIGFPVFNFGPLITALLLFLAGGLGLHAARDGLSQLPGGVAPSVSSKVKANFGITVALMTIAALSGVVAFLSGAVCAGTDITFYSGRGPNAQPIDVQQYCEPRKSGNAALAFVDGALCVLAMVWNLLGLCFYCTYGQLFGLKRRGIR